MHRAVCHHSARACNLPWGDFTIPTLVLRAFEPTTFLTANLFCCASHRLRLARIASIERRAGPQSAWLSRSPLAQASHPFRCKPDSQAQIIGRSGIAINDPPHSHSDRPHPPRTFITLAQTHTAHTLLPRWRAFCPSQLRDAVPSAVLVSPERADPEVLLAF